MQAAQNFCNFFLQYRHLVILLPFQIGFQRILYNNSLVIRRNLYPIFKPFDIHLLRTLDFILKIIIVISVRSHFQLCLLHCDSLLRYITVRDV